MELQLSPADIHSDLWIRVRHQLVAERARLLECLAGEDDPIAAAKLRAKCAQLRTMIESTTWAPEPPHEPPAAFGPMV